MYLVNHEKCLRLKLVVLYNIIAITQNRCLNPETQPHYNRTAVIYCDIHSTLVRAI